MNIAEYLYRTAGLTPERQALFSGMDCVANYGDFLSQAGQVAAWLQDRGVKAGNTVAIFMKNAPEYLVAQYGIWMAGAAVVAINAKLHGREAAWIIEDSQAKFVFASKSLHAPLIEAGCATPFAVVDEQGLGSVLTQEPLARPAPCAPDDLALLFYTSGTTGRPKGVMITHRMLCSMALCYFADVDDVTPDDTALYAAPLSHGAGLYNVMHVMRGARHVCPKSGGFEPDEIFDLAARHKRVHMFAAPTMVQRMTRDAKRLGLHGEGLRTIVYAGGPMYNADIIEAVDWFGDVFAQIYGQGECPMGITALPRAAVSDRSHPRWEARLGSVGRAQSAVEVMIGDTGGQELPRGQVGEIMVRGDTVMSGYWRNPEATAKTIVDGWLFTGDMGAMDDEGYVTLHDRSKDMIISGGSNIYPREVEEVLMALPEVAEVSVIGRPHAEWGEEVVAFVVMAEGAMDEARLDAHCLENIARFKRPKAYIEIEALPKNNYGKVLKTELRGKV